MQSKHEKYIEISNVMTKNEKRNDNVSIIRWNETKALYIEMEELL
jgi:hypothetical protein